MVPVTKTPAVIVLGHITYKILPYCCYILPLYNWLVYY